MAKPLNVPGSGSAGPVNMIAEGTVLEGTLRAAGDVRVSGRIIGTLQVEGKVIVTQEGRVEGELKAAHADIAGGVQGEIHVSERLVLRGTAHVEANVKTARFVMEEGAIFGGRCQMGEGRPILSGTDKPSTLEAKVLGQGPPAEGVKASRDRNEESPAGAQDRNRRPA